MRRSTILYAQGIAALLLVLAVPVYAASSYAEDRAEIEDLQARYMFAMDWRDADTYASCFTPDGVLDWGGGVEHGRKAIHDVIAGMAKRDAGVAAKEPGVRPARMRHFITNVVLKIDGDEAVGRAYWVAFDDMNPQRRAAVGAYGYYVDELVKLHGKWLFTKRTIYNEQLPKRAGSVTSPAW